MFVGPSLKLTQGNRSPVMLMTNQDADTERLSWCVNHLQVLVNLQVCSALLRLWGLKR